MPREINREFVDKLLNQSEDIDEKISDEQLANTWKTIKTLVDDAPRANKIKEDLTIVKNRLEDKRTERKKIKDLEKIKEDLKEE